MPWNFSIIPSIAQVAAVPGLEPFPLGDEKAGWFLNSEVFGDY